MGVWGFINTEAVKRNAPDLTSVKNAFRATYGCASAAFWKIDNAARAIILQNLKHYMPDEKGPAQFTLFAFLFAQNVAPYVFKETYKTVPGLALLFQLPPVILFLVLKFRIWWKGSG